MNNNVPLAEELRPKILDEIVGQLEILGEGQSLKVAIESSKLPSMILWGPPGVGKTTIARVIANTTDSEFISISAVLSGVKEIREAIEKSQFLKEQHQKKTILFIDEVHRFNKSQQDAFLPHIESGLITFIGATTENPSFEVNSALLSRCQVYILKSLSDDELLKILNKAFSKSETLVNDNAKELMISYANGDARRLLNLAEMIIYSGQPQKIAIDKIIVEKIISDKTRRFDKGGDQFYDQISAFHKSVRGSDPNASIYWLMKMLDGGADPLYLARRVIRIAIEDIGLADPRAQSIALESYQIYERLGFPEGELALCNATIYLAMAPKSNASYMAYNQVKSFVANQAHYDVPMHLRNAPTKLMSNLDYGKNYRYAHNEPEGFAAGENYFPTGLDAVEFYKPTDRGLEKKILEKINYLKKLDQDHKAKSRKND
ncbi:MAG: replication-associated recombination protein A [Proteobacteria bacterium]|jgi:putative ATPase|nr:replication-associated recombination protein A [Pseudomonadota bacterium]|tara:strand:+ start:60132 stop:61427 length:1296 start_codon:yes stop_codon:yes gene_type:complete